MAINAIGRTDSDEKCARCKTAFDRSAKRFEPKIYWSFDGKLCRAC